MRVIASVLTRSVAIAASDLLAMIRAGSARERVGLVAPLGLPIVVHGHPGTLDETLALLVAVILPVLAFAWGALWARTSSPRLRFVHAALPAPRAARALIAATATAAASLAIAFTSAVVAARAGSAAADALAVGRVAFASSFAFAGLGAAHAPRATWASLTVPALLGLAHTEGGPLSALIPNAHAYALTVHPPTGAEARARFAALLAFGMIGVIAFGLRRPTRSPAPRP